VLPEEFSGERVSGCTKMFLIKVDIV